MDLINAEIDEKNHIIYFTNVIGVDGLADKFEKRFDTFLKKKLDTEILNSIKYIEYLFQEKFLNKGEVNAYADFLRRKLNIYFEKKVLQDFPIISTYLDRLESLINQYSIQNTTIYQFANSFTLLANNSQKQIEIIEELFNLLTKEPSMIDCTKQDFVNAFTGKEVEKGINWLVIGKNKYTSKASLLYFIEKLIDNNFLQKNIIYDRYKYIEYIFRDREGNILENLKQSNQESSKKVSSQDRIDDIISNLLD